MENIKEQNEKQISEFKDKLTILIKEYYSNSGNMVREIAPLYLDSNIFANDPTIIGVEISFCK